VGFVPVVEAFLVMILAVESNGVNELYLNLMIYPKLAWYGM
jgi:hypothetical protein